LAIIAALDQVQGNTRQGETGTTRHVGPGERTTGLQYHETVVCPLLFAIIRYYSLLFAEELQSERPLLVIKIERQWTDLIGKYGSASAVPRDEIFTARASCKTIFGKTA
jgi:hypothetical protein